MDFPGKHPIETTEDAFLGGHVVVRQPKRGLRSGLDAVFLAAACPASPGDAVIEAGCGAGTAGLCLAWRVPRLRIVGVEIDKELAGLAAANAARNQRANEFTAVCADVTGPWSLLEEAGIAREAFDHVIANPPFYASQAMRAPDDAARGRACIMPEGGLEKWARFFASAARPGGTLTLIHRAEALSHLLAALGSRFGGLQIWPLFASADVPAIRMIIRGTKGSRAAPAIHRGIVLHKDRGTQTDEANHVLRDGAGFG